MWSEYPWTGHYDIQTPIWVTAHTTQFTQVGWNYLQHGYGVGLLPNGGSYVTLVPSGGNPQSDMTLIIETMSHDQSVCIRPPLNPYKVEQQTVTFKLTGGLQNIKNNTLYTWKSYLHRTGTTGPYFAPGPIINPSNGQFTMVLEVDTLWTVTTISTGKHGLYATPPASKPFSSLLPYLDTFENYIVDSEAKYWADQTGSWQIYKASDPNHNLVMRQMVTIPPITWCGEASSPITFISDGGLQDVNITCDVLIEQNGGWVVLGGRVPSGGCGDNYAQGYYFTLPVSGDWSLTSGGSSVIVSGHLSGLKINTWMTIGLVLRAI